MCCSRIFFASSINGRFSASLSAFHSAPSRLLSSELCIRGFSCASSFRRCFDHTMNAFMGRLMWSGERLDMTVIAKFALLHSRSSLQFNTQQVCVQKGEREREREREREGKNSDKIKSIPTVSCERKKIIFCIKISLC